MPSAARLLGLISGFLLLGCGDSATTTTAVLRPELVAVDPNDFLGTLTCDSQGVRSYVATLYDVTPDADGGVPDPGEPLPSSPPTSCLFPVTFSNVVTLHRYVAQVDGYDRVSQSDADRRASGRDDASGSGGEAGAGGAFAVEPDPGDIAPKAPGSRSQLDRAGKRVAARWVATCSAYPPSPGAQTETGGASGIDVSAAGAGADDGTPGVVSYDGLTQTPHNCGAGLRPVSD